MSRIYKIMAKYPNGKIEYVTLFKGEITNKNIDYAKQFNSKKKAIDVVNLLKENLSGINFVVFSLVKG